MPSKGGIKEKTKKIIKVLPELNCGKCGFNNCGEFAKAVAKGRAPCDGCISGGPSVANKVCEIMGVRTPETAKIPVSYSGFSRPGIASSGMDRGRGRGLGRSQDIKHGPGSGKGFGRRGGKGRFGR